MFYCCDNYCYLIFIHPRKILRLPIIKYIRNILKYSPYYFLTSIKIASKDYELSSKEAIKCRDFLEKKLNNEDIILGPTTASMFKINNIYRFQIIIKYKEEKHVLKVLHELDDMCLRNQKVNLEIDIHPVKI